ncbi:MAG TPA: alpha/beta hydrolase [Acidimicrobiales bacterium]|nr:alpha/beta hydrolase [Acidimicrobiales bacterium]
MDSTLPPLGLHFVPETPVRGLAVAESRVAQPRATIICVHGGLDRGGSFARLARRMDSFDVVAYDRRGYQGSRSLAPLDLDHHVDDLLALAETEAQHGPVIIFGHSFGGVVALGAAMRRPELVHLVIAYESPLPWILHRPSSRPPMTDDAPAEAERFFRRMVSNGAWERLNERERESRRLDGPALLADLGGLHDGGQPYDLAELKVPFYYLYGDGIIHDYYEALCAELAKVAPTVRCRELENASHGAHLSNPDQLAAIIEDAWEAQCVSG